MGFSDVYNAGVSAAIKRRNRPDFGKEIREGLQTYSDVAQLLAGFGASDQSDKVTEVTDRDTAQAGLAQARENAINDAVNNQGFDRDSAASYVDDTLGYSKIAQGLQDRNTAPQYQVGNQTFADRTAAQNTADIGRRTNYANILSQKFGLQKQADEEMDKITQARYQRAAADSAELGVQEKRAMQEAGDWYKDAVKDPVKGFKAYYDSNTGAAGQGDHANQKFNAVKHDGGYSFWYTDDKGMPVSTPQFTSENDAQRYLRQAYMDRLSMVNPEFMSKNMQLLDQKAYHDHMLDLEARKLDLTDKRDSERNALMKQHYDNELKKIGMEGARWSAMYAPENKLLGKMGFIQEPGQVLNGKQQAGSRVAVMYGKNGWERVDGKPLDKGLLNTLGDGGAGGGLQEATSRTASWMALPEKDRQWYRDEILMTEPDTSKTKDHQAWAARKQKADAMYGLQGATSGGGDMDIGKPTSAKPPAPAEAAAPRVDPADLSVVSSAGGKYNVRFPDGHIEPLDWETMRSKYSMSSTQLPVR